MEQKTEGKRQEEADLRREKRGYDPSLALHHLCDSRGGKFSQIAGGRQSCQAVVLLMLPLLLLHGWRQEAFLGKHLSRSRRHGRGGRRCRSQGLYQQWAILGHRMLPVKNSLHVGFVLKGHVVLFLGQFLCLAPVRGPLLTVR